MNAGNMIVALVVVVAIALLIGGIQLGFMLGRVFERWDRRK